MINRVGIIPRSNYALGIKNINQNNTFKGSTEEDNDKMIENAAVIAERIIHEKQNENSYTHYKRIQKFFEQGGTLTQLSEGVQTAIQVPVFILQNSLLKVAHQFQRSGEMQSAVKVNALREFLDSQSQLNKKTAECFATTADNLS